MTRQAPTPRVAVMPSMLGMGLPVPILSMVGLASILVLETSDPAQWLTKVGGNGLGAVALLFVIAANFGTATAGIYASTVGLKSVPGLRKVSWNAALALSLVPVMVIGVLVPNWFFDHFGTFLAYIGVFFAPMVGIQIVDYFVLRHQRISLRAIYDPSPQADYAYWHGLNPAAVVAMLAGVGTYLYLLNPQSYAIHEPFSFVGASLPSAIVAAVVHVGLTQVLVRRAGRGGYPVTGTAAPEHGRRCPRCSTSPDRYAAPPYRPSWKDLVVPEQLPQRARIVVVGGGVIGCSLAYHLAKRGESDVLLLEQNTLTSGTTWHAAGLVTQARPTSGTREIVKRSLEVYRCLEAETGLSTGYTQTGTLHLALSEARRQELLRTASTSRGNGIPVEVLGPEETLELFPLLAPEGLVCSLYYPDEGRATATDITMSLARGARSAVRASWRESPSATSSSTTAARWGCAPLPVTWQPTTWSTAPGCGDGRPARWPAPATRCRRSRTTTSSPKRSRTCRGGMPTIKSGDDWSYVKDDAGSLMVGFFEPGSDAWSSRGIPESNGFIHLPEDWDHIGPFYERMIERIPVLADAGIRLFFSGPEASPPTGSTTSARCWAYATTWSPPGSTP